MGAILAGIIQGLGQHAQRQNEENILAQVKANGDMAQLIEKQAASANTPQDQIELMQLAAKYRALGAKKPSKDMDLHNIFQQKNAAMIQQASQNQQQQNSMAAQQKAAQIQQAQGTVAQGVTGDTMQANPDGGLVRPLSITQMSQKTGGSGLPPPNPTSAAAQPGPAAGQNAPTPPPPPGPSPDAQAGAPPPVSGLPSPGFNTVAPTNTPSTGEFISPSGDTMGRVLRSPFRTPEEQQAFEARGAGLKQGAIEQAGVEPSIAKTRGNLQAQYELYEKKFKEVTGYVDRLNQNKNSDVEWTVEMSASGMPIAKMDRGVGTGIVSGADVGNLPVIGGGVKRDDATYTLVRYGNGKEKLSPVSPILGQGYTTGPDGKQTAVQYNKRVQGSAAAAGIQPPATFNPKLFNLQGGGVGIASPAQIAAGGAPAAVPGAIGTGAPTTSVQSSPGAPSVTTVRTKGAAPKNITPTSPAAGGAPASTQKPLGAYERTAPLGLRLQADRVQAGDAALPAGREGQAVAQIIAERQARGATNGIPTPLTAAGQANIQSVDAVFKEIDDATKALDEIKGNPYLGAAYIKYKNGFSTPYDSLFTKLSFEGLRSASAALKGNNSRAYPVIQRAFQHVPNLDRLGGLNPDSIALIKDKLNAMRDVLKDTRNSVLEDQRKSGVVAPLNPPAPNGGAVVHWGRDAQGNPVRLSQ